MTKYNHSTYWYVKKSGKTLPARTSFTKVFLDGYSNTPNKIWGFPALEASIKYNPASFTLCVMADIGCIMAHEVKRIVDPVERERIKEELQKMVRKLRRRSYAENEVRCRRLLRVQRRKVKPRRTLSNMPTVEEIKEAWEKRKTSKSAMIHLGGMIHDLECYVDNYLRIDDDGNIIGRNHGIKGWLQENIPELFPKYKTLMRYKAMAIHLRQATETKDPMPTEVLLSEPHHKVLVEIFDDPRNTFISITNVLNYYLSPEYVCNTAPSERRKRLEKRVRSRKQALK